MDFFDQPRYKINKTFLRFVGLWPYQKKAEQRFFFSFCVLFSMSLATCLVRKTIIEIHQREIVMEAIPIIIIDICCVIKVTNSLVNSTKMRELLRCIKEDMEAPMGPEKKVLLQVADEGRTWTIIYIVFLYCTTICYMVLPVAPRIIVALGWANMSTPNQFAFPVDYMLDPDEYYTFIQIHSTFGTFIIVSMIISIDCLFVVNIQHVCGVFAAISYRLENLISDDSLNLELYPDRLADEAFLTVIECIKSHKRAIQFAELIEATYSWSFFITIGFNTLVLSFGGYQAVLYLANNEIEQLIVQIMFIAGLIMHLFFESFFSQRLTDYSYGIYEALNQVKWYKTSMRTRKLLNFMLMRSSLPSELKAGKIYTMSMENFSAIVRTSMSYFTLLCSMQ